MTLEKAIVGSLLEFLRYIIQIKDLIDLFKSQVEKSKMFINFSPLTPPGQQDQHGTTLHSVLPHTIPDDYKWEASRFRGKLLTRNTYIFETPGRVPQ